MFKLDINVTVYQCSECEWRSDESVTQTQKRFNTEMTSGGDPRSLLCTT